MGSRAVEKDGLVVDSAFEFAGPQMKKLANTKNVLRQRVFLLAFKLMKCNQRLEYYETEVKRKDDRVREYARLMEEEEVKGENRLRDLKKMVETLRSDKQKLHDEVQRYVNEAKAQEELYAATLDEITQLRAENKLLSSQVQCAC